MEWDEEQEQYARSQVEKHRNSPVPEEEQGKKQKATGIDFCVVLKKA